MSEHIENGYQIYRPSFAERVWRALGYRAAPPAWAESDAAREKEPTRWARDGEVIFGSRARFGVLDRLRFLLSGSIEIQGRMLTSVPVPDAHCFITWGIIEPIKVKRNPAKAASE